MAVQQNYIAGEWSGGGAVNRNLNPSNTDDVVGEYARADRGDVERAIASAASSVQPPLKLDSRCKSRRSSALSSA